MVPECCWPREHRRRPAERRRRAVGRAFFFAAAVRDEMGRRRVSRVATEGEGNATRKGAKQKGRTHPARSAPVLAQHCHSRHAPRATRRARAASRAAAAPPGRPSSSSFASAAAAAARSSTTGRRSADRRASVPSESLRGGRGRGCSRQPNARSPDATRAPPPRSAPVRPHVLQPGGVIGAAAERHHFAHSRPGACAAAPARSRRHLRSSQSAPIGTRRVKKTAAACGTRARVMLPARKTARVRPCLQRAPVQGRCAGV